MSSEWILVNTPTELGRLPRQRYDTLQRVVYYGGDNLWPDQSEHTCWGVDLCFAEGGVCNVTPVGQSPQFASFQEGSLKKLVEYETWDASNSEVWKAAIGSQLASVFEVAETGKPDVGADVVLTFAGGYRVKIRPLDEGTGIRMLRG